jgi:glycosyltransferase involved in cell wall biosynthesis
MVSVVIPAFNQGRFLPAAIDSALAQTYRDREIIVVDDGSTDETPAVAQRYGEAVRCVRQANAGLAGARNAGINRARGTFVALLDRDHVWLPGFLEHMLGVADAHPRSAVYFSAWRYVDSAGNLLPEPPHAHAVPHAMMYRALLRANFIVPSTVMMRRAAVVSAGLFDERFRRLEDWDRGLFCELAWGGQPAGYRRLAGTVDADDCARTVLGIVGAAVDRAGAGVRRACYGHAHFAVGSIAYGCGRMARARHHLMIGARHWPPLLLDAQFGSLIGRASVGAKPRAWLKRVKARLTATSVGGPLT